MNRKCLVDLFVETTLNGLRVHSNEYGHFKWFIYFVFGAKVALDKATKLVGAMHAEISRTQCAWSVKSVHTKFMVQMGKLKGI